MQDIAAKPQGTSLAQPQHHDALTALCAIARFHQVAADPATLAHQLGIAVTDPVTPDSPNSCNACTPPKGAGSWLTASTSA